MQVYHKTNSCYCFSTNCKTNGKSLDVIDFILHKEGCSKREAILKAKELTGVTHSRLPQKPTENQAGFLTKMFTYFKKAIHNSKPAKEYLQSRCLDKQKTEVGYNSGAVPSRLPPQRSINTVLFKIWAVIRFKRKVQNRQPYLQALRKVWPGVPVKEPSK